MHMKSHKHLITTLMMIRYLHIPQSLYMYKCLEMESIEVT